MYNGNRPFRFIRMTHNSSNGGLTSVVVLLLMGTVALALSVPAQNAEGSIWGAVRSGVTKETLAADVSGVQTPGFVVGKEVLRGAAPFSAFRATIERQLGSQEAAQSGQKPH